MTNFKVGDKVRIINALGISPAELTTGKIYEIVRVESDAFYVMDDVDDEMSVCNFEYVHVEKVDVVIAQNTTGDTSAIHVVTLYTKSGNDHKIQLSDADLARLETDLSEDRADNFAQYYCLDDKSVVGVRLTEVELFTAKKVSE